MEYMLLFVLQIYLVDCWFDIDVFYNILGRFHMYLILSQLRYHRMLVFHIGLQLHLQLYIIHMDSSHQ